MTKFERAIEEAGKLSEDVQERLGDDLLHYIHKYLALRADLEAGLAELDAGERVSSAEVFAELKARYGN